jgi:hypothetical protein
VQQYWFNFSDYGTFTGKVEKTNVFTWQVRNETACKNVMVRKYFQNSLAGTKR